VRKSISIESSMGACLGQAWHYVTQAIPSTVSTILIEKSRISTYRTCLKLDIKGSTRPIETIARGLRRKGCLALRG